MLSAGLPITLSSSRRKYADALDSLHTPDPFLLPCDPLEVGPGYVMSTSEQVAASLEPKDREVRG